MESQKQREIARKGGMAAHRKGTAHEFTTDEARNAGRKGGQLVSANRSHMIEIGRVGGKRSAERRRQNVPRPGHNAPATPYRQEHSAPETAPPGTAGHHGPMDSELEESALPQPPGTERQEQQNSAA